MIILTQFSRNNYNKELRVEKRIHRFFRIEDLPIDVRLPYRENFKLLLSGRTGAMMQVACNSPQVHSG